MKSSLIKITGYTGAILFAVTAIVSGFQFESYSHISQFISEAYAYGTPWGPWLRGLGYIPAGILMAVFAFAASSHFKEIRRIRFGFIGIAVFYGLSTVLVSLFPCDEGCNKELIDPSIAQIVHNASSFLTYVFTPLSLLFIGLGFANRDRLMSRITIGAALLSGLFVAMLFSDPVGEFIGLYQRMIEGTILTWIILSAWMLGNGKLQKPDSNRN